MKIYAKLALIPTAFILTNDGKTDDDIPDKYWVWYGKWEYQQALNLYFIVFINPTPALIWEHFILVEGLI